MPRPVLRATLVLCLLAAGLGFWLGAKDLRVTESDVIDAAVALWVSETGDDDVSTCVAYAPPMRDVWLEVRCGMGDTKRVYVFDDDGDLKRNTGPEA